jgi:hypothetical protein
MFDPSTIEPTNKLAGNTRRTRRLQKSGQRLEFSPTLRPVVSIVLFGVSLHLPFLFIAFMVCIGEIEHGLPGGLYYGVLLISCTMISIWLFKRVTYPVYFDLNERYFHSKNNRRSGHIKFNEIARLHVISKKWHSGSDYFTGFELLLILINSERVMVVDHADGGTLKKEAELLAKALNVPWSVSVYR